MVDSRRVPLLQTALNPQHRLQGAKLVDYAGWEMPVQYSGVLREHQMVREAAGLFDVSHMGRLAVTGTAAMAAVDGLIANDFSKVSEGAGIYSCCCNADGGIVDDLIAYRTGATDVLVVCNASNRARMSELFSEHCTGCSVQDMTSQTVLLALQGPKACQVAEAAGFARGLSKRVRPFGVRREPLGDLEVVVARTGYTGEDGLEIMVSAEKAEELWQRLLVECSHVGGGPVGLAARDTLRLEAAFRLYGNELSERVNPYEAGLGWTVDLQSGDFVGRLALAQLKDAPRPKKLVGFEMVGRGIARAGYKLYEPAGTLVGDCTSGSHSPTLGRAIGLGFVAAGHNRVGQRLAVDCRGRSVEAKVVKLPFYRRKAIGNPDA